MLLAVALLSAFGPLRAAPPAVPAIPAGSPPARTSPPPLRVSVSIDAKVGGTTLYTGTVRVDQTSPARYSQQETQAPSPACSVAGERSWAGRSDDSRRDASITVSASPARRYAANSSDRGSLTIEASMTRPAANICEGSRTVSARRTVSLCQRGPILLTGDGGLSIRATILTVEGGSPDATCSAKAGTDTSR